MDIIMAALGVAAVIVVAYLFARYDKAANEDLDDNWSDTWKGRMK